MIVAAQVKSTTICANPYELKIQTFFDVFIKVLLLDKQNRCKNVLMKNNIKLKE